mmetsp:Transcript_23461/g.89130  ORF Transcript_23461/g.89130 Transcript_23461/m.89130 type:complete len:201 (-) Transcript_23461:570-1172(-)
MVLVPPTMISRPVRSDSRASADCSCGEMPPSTNTMSRGPRNFGASGFLYTSTEGAAGVLEAAAGVALAPARGPARDRPWPKELSSADRPPAQLSSCVMAPLSTSTPSVSTSRPSAGPPAPEEAAAAAPESPAPPKAEREAGWSAATGSFPGGATRTEERLHSSTGSPLLTLAADWPGAKGRGLPCASAMRRSAASSRRER